MLFHLSEQQGIECFEPRPSQFCIDQNHLRNYLVPRECPRVTYYAGFATMVAHVDRYALPRLSNHSFATKGLRF